MNKKILHDSIFPTHVSSNWGAEKLESLFEPENNLSIIKN